VLSKSSGVDFATAWTTLQPAMSWGYISSAGVLQAGGGGLTSVRNSAGNYTLGWTAFTATPAIVGTSQGNQLIPYVGALAGSPAGSTGAQIVWAATSGGAASDTAFFVIVVGSR
jgi:hypothetical protein